MNIIYQKLNDSCYRSYFDQHLFPLVFCYKRLIVIKIRIRVFLVSAGENLVPEPQVQDETGATGEGHARGPSRGGRGQRAVVAQTGGRARSGAGRQAVHQPAAGRGRRKDRANGVAVVFASADARPDAKDVVVTAVVVAKASIIVFLCTMYYYYDIVFV